MAVAKRYRVTLTTEERDELRRMISRGKADARKLAHARILLKADERGRPGAGGRCGSPRRWRSASAPSSGCGSGLSSRGWRPHCCPSPPSGPARKLDGEQEAHLIALACTRPPEGKARWTLRLLAERLVELEHVDAISHETVRQTLKKTSSSRG